MHDFEPLHFWGPQLATPARVRARTKARAKARDTQCT